MKSLKQLTLNGCNLTDRGVAEILKALEADSLILEVLELSGNAIGQSSYFDASATQLVNYLEKNKIIERLCLDNNMLRGKLGEKIVRKIIKCTCLQYLSLANNFLGQKSNCSQPPVCFLANLLISSNQLEHLDISYN